MTTFDDRENAFENKFAHHEELKFRAEARRNKLVGLWAAGLLGKNAAEADAYAREMNPTFFWLRRPTGSSLDSTFDQMAAHNRKPNVLALRSRPIASSTN